MKRLLILLLICGLLILPTMAMIVEEPKEGKVTEQPTLLAPKETILPIERIHPGTIILPDETPLPILPKREIYKKTLIQYSEKTTLLKRITMVFDKIIGLTPVEDTTSVTDVDVVVDDMTVAIIPTDSKFNGIEPHEYCLEYQYGTTNWFNCEQELL
jgi:hypothetical protein